VVLEQLEALLAGHQGPIEQAGELLAGIDERRRAVRELLERVEGRSRQIDRQTAETEQRVRELEESFRARLRTLVDTALGRFDETEDQLSARSASLRADLLERLERLRASGESVLAGFEARGQALREMVERACERAENDAVVREASAERALAQAESMRLALDEVGVSTAVLLESAGHARTALEASLDRRAHEAEAAVEQAGAQRLSALTMALEHTAREAESRIAAAAASGSAQLAVAVAQAERAAARHRVDAAAAADMRVELDTMSAAMLALTERVMQMERAAGHTAATPKRAPTRKKAGASKPEANESGVNEAGAVQVENKPAVRSRPSTPA
jgi:hypothetical protein